MLLLIQFLTAHFVGDFFLQPNTWVARKEARKLRAKELYFHIAVHALLLILFTLDPGLWAPIAVIVVCHFIIDSIKLILQNEKTRSIWFFTDQILHVITIIVVWYIWKGSTVHVAFFNSVNFWVICLAALFLTTPTSYVIRNLISKLPVLSDNPSITDAGKYIGMIERLFIFIFMVTNHWQAVGFILAAKSIFRFGDLKGDNRKLTEYVLIGTLLSFGVAILISLVVFYVVTDKDGAFHPILILDY